jgi:hypothetical protein
MPLYGANTVDAPLQNVESPKKTKSCFSVIGNPLKVDFLLSRATYGHNKHINAVWSARDAFELEHGGASRVHGVLFWPLNQRD